MKFKRIPQESGRSCFSRKSIPSTALGASAHKCPPTFVFIDLTDELVILQLSNAVMSTGRLALHDIMLSYKLASNK
jgi:hypothetical protein